MLRFYDFKGNAIWFNVNNITLVKEILKGKHIGGTRVYVKGNKKPWLVDFPIEKSIVCMNKSLT